MAFADHFSRQSSQYTQFRPRYPAELFAYLASLVERHDCTWDCGTGNGQAAVDLANHFARVVATDPSVNQIAHAIANKRVEYLVAAAEGCPLPADSVDLVAVAQAVHWFDRPRFYDEVRRVARPGGVLAVWSYPLATITPQVDALIWELYGPIVGAYWPPERSLIMERYATIEFPFEEIPPPAFTMTAEWTLDDLLGYLGTWSSVVRYRQDRDVDPLSLIDKRLSEAWGPPNVARTVHWPLYIRVGRIG
jgi:SAM-dependent methyltransferase